MTTASRKATFLVCAYTDIDCLAHCPKGPNGRGVYTIEYDEARGLRASSSDSSSDDGTVGHNGSLTNGSGGEGANGNGNGDCHNGRAVNNDNDERTNGHRNASGTGVHAPANANAPLRMTGVSSLGRNVAFLLQAPGEAGAGVGVFYGTTECIDTEGDVFVSCWDPASRTLKLKSRRNAHGRSTCYLHLDEGQRFLTAVNYWDATLAQFPVDAARATIGEPVEVVLQPGAEYVQTHSPSREEHWTFRQRWPHAHCMVSEPYTHAVACVIDLGTDRILGYTVDPTTGRLRKVAAVQLPRKSGPRFLVFHPHHRVAYVVNELDSSVSVLRYNAPPLRVGAVEEEGDAEESNVPVIDSTTPGAMFEELQTIPTIPGDFDNAYTHNAQGVWKAANHSSEIRLHPSGRFLYIGNRGHDSVAVYGVDDADGTLHPVEFVKSGGRTPRSFGFSPDGRTLLVGNQDSGCCVLFHVDAKTGRLQEAARVDVPSPNYVVCVEGA